MKIDLPNGQGINVMKNRTIGNSVTQYGTAYGEVLDI